MSSRLTVLCPLRRNFPGTQLQRVALLALVNGKGAAIRASPALQGLSQRNLSILKTLQLPILRRRSSEFTQEPEVQVKLFETLLEGDDKLKEELISRYEDLTGLNNSVYLGKETLASSESNAILASDELFRLYLRASAALASASSDPSDLFVKINMAPLKRVEILGKETAQLVEDATAAPAKTEPALAPSNIVAALFQNSSKMKNTTAKVASSGGYSSWSDTSTKEPIRVVVEEAKSPILLRSLRFIFMAFIYSFLFLSLLSLLLDSSGILKATSQSTLYTPTPPPDADDKSGRGTTFKDVHGCEEAKDELYEIVEFLKDPKKFEKLGGKLPRGVLLTGPPGTGKTLLARAIAGEAGVNFYTASGSEFDEMYVGVGARRIRELFAAARKNAPAIIFIDELDAIGGKRSPKDQHYVKQTLNQLLVELDGFNPGEGIILVGATNFPESLDKALIRPGRFDRHVAVPLPDVRGRMEILKHHMEKIHYDKSSVDISIIARGTIGFSGADLQALVNQAAVRASSEDADTVEPSHFEWAKERIMMGAARKSAYITEKDKLATAYHEGGHALVALYTTGAYPLQSITVVPRGMALGYTLMLPEMDKTSHTFKEYRAKLDVAMGGRIAEELIYGKDNVTDGASSDIASATSLASNMVRRFGFSDKIGPVNVTADSDEPLSSETQAAVETEIRSLVEDAQSRAKALLTERRHELDLLAKALVEYETLDANEVQKVLRGEKIRQDTAK